MNKKRRNAVRAVAGLLLQLLISVGAMASTADNPKGLSNCMLYQGDYTEGMHPFVTIMNGDGQKGIYSIAKDSIILDCNYDNVEVVFGDCIKASKDMDCKLVDSDGNEIYRMGEAMFFEKMNDDIILGIFHEGFYVYNLHTKQRFNNTSYGGDTILSRPENSHSDYFVYADLKKSTRPRTGLLDNNLNIVVKPVFEDLLSPTEGLCAFKKTVAGKERWGFMDMNCQMVIPAIYREVRPFADGFAWVRLNDKQCNFIDRKGRLLIKGDPYMDAYDFNNGGCVVKEEYGYGVINRRGQRVISCNYMHAEVRDSDIVRLMTYSGKMVYANLLCQQVAPFIDYTKMNAVNDSEGIIVVNTLDSCGFYDKYGRINYGDKYIKSSIFVNGVARVQARNGMWGIIDKGFNEIVPCQYDYVYGVDTNLGIAIVKKDGVTQRCNVTKSVTQPVAISHTLLCRGIPVI